MLPLSTSLAIATLTGLLSYTNPQVTVSKVSHPHLLLSQKPSQLKDMLVIPGERVGLVTKTTTRQDLAKLFGESRLKDSTQPGAEGIGTLAMTRVNLGLQCSFTVIWRDATRLQPSEIRNLGTAWKTPQGIRVGTSFAELRKQLGEFQLYGLEWDYGGTILLQGTRLSRYQDHLILRVQAEPNAATKFPRDYQAISGDQELSSTNPHWKNLGMRVGEMIVILNAIE